MNGATSNIDLSQAKDMLCGNCGGDIFAPGFKFKKISRLLTGTPQDAVIPIELYLCVECGEPLEELLPKEARKPKLENGEKGEGNKTIGLI